MTVQELIETLIGFPQSAVVVVQDSRDPKVLVDLIAARSVALIKSGDEAEWYYHSAQADGSRSSIRAVELMIGDDGA